jgi:hypothetical protein
MDDFNISSLHESKNEWGARLITILTPLIIEGFKSIFDESFKLCKENDELDKYLMTFQNFIARIPKWNPAIIEQEKKRIIEKSGCTYLEELVTCVHIIQLKILTAMRVGQKQKKIDINIPKLEDFIHKAYIHSARKIYKNVYLFEIGIPPLQIQKHHREIETIIQECILNAIRESIPVESILRAYMDETVEEEVVEEIKEQKIVEQLKPKEHISEHIEETKAAQVAAAINETSTPSPFSNVNHENNQSYVPTPMSSFANNQSVLKFNDVDSAIYSDNREERIDAPKNVERLEEISNLRNIQRKMEEEDEYEEDKINISDQYASLSDFDVHNIDEPLSNLIPDLIFDDVEVLN